jgi:predicted Ser/Thr protein kinase
MFKAPIKVLHPLLTATQEGNYVGTENSARSPSTGIVLAHSNESEWRAFKNNKTNEAFIDRIYVVKVPYALRVTEETRIYDKLVRSSSLADATLRAGNAGNAGPVLGSVAPEASRKTRTCSRRCASMTARASRKSIPSAKYAIRNTATRRALTKA